MVITMTDEKKPDLPSYEQHLKALGARGLAVHSSDKNALESIADSLLKIVAMMKEKR